MRRLLSSLLFVAGAFFALAAAAKLIFGVAMDLPLLPPVALAGINAAVALGASLTCFAAAALVGRRRSAARPTISGPAA